MKPNDFLIVSKPIVVTCICKTNEIVFDKKMYKLPCSEFQFWQESSNNVKGDIRKLITRMDVSNLLQINIKL